MTFFFIFIIFAVGFRGVEFNFLNPELDVQKIRLFLKNYTLPEIHRTRIWKLLLGLLVFFNAIFNFFLMIKF